MMRRNTRIVFFGTPFFAVPALEGLQSAGALLTCVTAAAQPAGRGNTLTQPPVRAAADRLGIACLQPEKLDEAFLDAFRSLQPAVAVVAAYGKIFKPELLAIPPHGFVNVHPSLLPRHRGASPIPAAILAGDTGSGVTIMKLDKGLDTGPTLAARAVPLQGTETAGSLTETLAAVGAELLLEILPKYLDGRVDPMPQPAAGATLTKPLSVADARLDFSLDAPALERRVRAFSPRPGAWCRVAEKRLKILAASVVAGTADGTPGTVVRVPNEEALAMVCGDQKLLRCALVQVEGKSPCAARDFFNGYRSLLGQRAAG